MNLSLPENYNYYNISENTIRTKFQNSDEVQQWVADLQECTKNTWHITNTLITCASKSKKYLFKRIYHCHFKTRINKISQPRKRKHASRNINCPAQLVIVIKRQLSRKSKVKPDDLIDDWPCVIVFKNNHNHTVTSVAALTKRPIGEETKKQIIGLFNKGHSVASAYSTFCLSKMVELGDRYDSYAADRHYFPTKSDFSNLWKSNVAGNCCDRTPVDDKQMREQVERNLSKSDGVLYKVSCVGEDCVVSLCTAIMQRAARELAGSSSEILIVDTSNNYDDVQPSRKLYFFVVRSPAGTMPLGCIVTSSEKGELFDAGVGNLRNMLPVEIVPRAILTGSDMTEQRDVLKKYWPDSTLFLCPFQALKAAWRWLCSAKNKINKDDRPELYRLFGNALLSTTAVEMERAAHYFYRSPFCARYPLYKNYVDNVVNGNNLNFSRPHYDRQQNLTVRGTDATGYVQIMFRLFKDVSLEQARTYNVTQLTDFLVNSFESYYRQRLLDLVVNRLSSVTVSWLSPNDKDDDNDDSADSDRITELGGMQYYVRYGDDEYFVDMNCNVCTCFHGTVGKVCKHQLAIVKHYNRTNTCNVLLSAEQKTVLYRIATGTETETRIIPGNSLGNANNRRQCPPSNICNAEKVDSVSRESKWNDFLQAFDRDIRKNLKDDPDRFFYALDKFMDNYRNNVKDAQSLRSGLMRSFPNVS